MSKINAALRHLLISLLIFSLMISVLVLVWYPAPYFTASGGLSGLKITAMVDLVLGPVLTFVLFDHKKTKLALITDFSLIGLFQISALSWGILTIYQQRPIATVFWEDTFYTVPAISFDEQSYNYEDLSNLDSINSPVLIFAEKPASLIKLTEMQRVIIEDQIPPYEQVALYRPWIEHFDEVKSIQVDINEITSINEEMQNSLVKILEEEGRSQDDYVYFPLKSKDGNIILMFSEQGELQHHIKVPTREVVVSR